MEGDCLAVGFLLLRTRIDYIVLREIECRGVEEIGAADVHVVELTLAVAFADHGNVLEVGIRIEVAGFGDCLKDGHLVTVDSVCAVTPNGAEHGIMEVLELDVYDRVFDVVAADDAVANQFGSLNEGESGEMQLSEHRKTDVAFAVHAIYVLVL